MNTATSIFADITAVLEDMHGVAVEGQSRVATPEEGWALLASLRQGVQQVSRLMVEAALALG